MNPDTNRFEPLTEEDKKDLKQKQEAVLSMLENNHPLLRPDGTPVPRHWSVFRVGERVVIKNYTFEVKYIGETAILFEPTGPKEAA